MMLLFKNIRYFYLKTLVFTFSFFLFGHSFVFAQSTALQNFPNKPIKILVGFSQGGAPDFIARIIAQKLSESWKQPVIVENKVGAGGALAAQFLSTSPADGYTLLSITSSHAVLPALNSQLPYDTLKDFTGVTLTSIAPTWVLVSPSLGVKNLQELLTLAKSGVRELNYSSAGIGSFMHFSGELFKEATGINAVHIPYRGPSEAIIETASGRIDFVLSPIGASSGLVKEGKLIAINVTGKERIAEFPMVPTLAESGLPGFYLTTFTGLIAPGKTPPVLIEKLSQEIGRILALPDVKTKFKAFGVDSTSSSGEEFDKMIAEKVATFSKTAKLANLIKGI